MEFAHLVPSANSNLSHMLAVNSDGGVFSYASRSDVIIVRNADQKVHEFRYSYIPNAHKNCRITGVLFANFPTDNEDSLITSGDNSLKIWSLEGVLLHHCSFHPKATVNTKFLDLDWFPGTNMVVAVSESGNVTKWNVDENKAYVYSLNAKIRAKCLAACPHDQNLIAIGTNNGFVMIYSLSGTGKILHKIRSHDLGIAALSWCPVPHNPFEGLKGDENNLRGIFLLASISKDDTIYICRAGTTGYCETIVTLPSSASFNSKKNNYRNQFPVILPSRVLKWITSNTLITNASSNELILLHFIGKKSKSEVPATASYCVEPVHSIYKKNITALGVSVVSERGNCITWTFSTEKLFVRTRIRDGIIDKPVVLPAISGFVYDLAYSPVNSDIVGVALGDSKICVWNIRTRSFQDVMRLSQKIDSRVMSIAWHPVYEGILAFGTYEGCVSLQNIHQGCAPPKLMKVFHSKPIYKLQWMPPVKGGGNDKLLHLFAVGNGEILQYNPTKCYEMPLRLRDILAPLNEQCKCREITDLSGDPTRALAAIGMANGDVCVCEWRTLKLLQVMRDQSGRGIMAMKWFPSSLVNGTVYSGQCANWLAVGGETICIYEADGNKPAKRIAAMNQHRNRISSVEWSPHKEGLLLSTSMDGTAIIWDVLKDALLGQYVQHSGPVFAGIWHPTNASLAITGSADCTCRMWNVWKDVIPVGKKGAKEEDGVKGLPAPVTVIYMGNMEDDKDKTISSPKKCKDKSWMPTVQAQFHPSNMLDVAVDSRIKAKEGVSAEENGVKMQVNYSYLFGSKEQVEALIQAQEETLADTNISLVWSQSRGNLESKIMDAIRKNRVTETMLALAPSVSLELWKKACRVYAEQAARGNETDKVVNFQLALGDVNGALNALHEKRMLKEALAIARCRQTEEEAAKVASELGGYSLSYGGLRLSAHCHLFLNDELEACRVLNRSSDWKDRFLSAKLLKWSDPEKGKDCAARVFKECLMAGNVPEAGEMLRYYPLELAYFQPWLLAAKYFRETRKGANDVSIAKWLVGACKERPMMGLKCDDVDLCKLEEEVANGGLKNIDKAVIFLALFVNFHARGEKEKGLRYLLMGIQLCYEYGFENSSWDWNIHVAALLKVAFPGGISHENDLSDGCERLIMAAKAHFVHFTLLWLIRTKDVKNGLPTPDYENAIAEGEDLKVTNSCELKTTSKMATLVKMKELLDTFLPYAMMQESANYYVNKRSMELEELNDCSDKVEVENAEFESDFVSVPDPFIFYDGAVKFLKLQKNSQMAEKLIERLKETAIRNGIIKADL